jgi:putative hydrolase
MFDLHIDAHVHTAFSAGRDSVSVLVGAAEQVGVSELTFADRVGPDSGWLPSYLASIQRAQQRTDLTLRLGAEVEAIGTDGWLAFPSDLGGLEVISVGLGRLPLPAGLVGPSVVKSLIAAGSVAVADVIEQLVTVTCLAVERVSRYAPTRLARPLEFLARAGIDDDAIGGDAVAALAAACRVHGTVVEISERYRTPSVRLAVALSAAGVPLVAASDAHGAGEVGRWDHVLLVAAALGDVTPKGSRCAGSRRGWSAPP